MLWLLLTIAIVLSLLCYYLIKRTRSITLEAAESKRLKLPILESITPNCSQSISIYDTQSSKTIQKAFTTVTVRSGLDPYNLFFADGESSFYLNLVLKHKAPCFYIFNKSKPFVHPGKTFCKPYLLNKSKYAVFGTVSDKLSDFLHKFDFDYFYSSYLPSNFDEKDLNANTVELKIPLNSVNQELLDAFIEIFETVEHESENKYQRIIKEFELMRKQQLSKENQGILQQINNELLKNKRK